MAKLLKMTKKILGIALLLIVGILICSYFTTCNLDHKIIDVNYIGNNAEAVYAKLYQNNHTVIGIPHIDMQMSEGEFVDYIHENPNVKLTVDARGGDFDYGWIITFKNGIVVEQRNFVTCQGPPFFTFLYHLTPVHMTLDSQRITNNNNVANGFEKSNNSAYSVALSENCVIEFVKINAGSFLMGSPENEKNRHESETRHRVTISHDYYLSQYEITQLQWRTVMENKTARYKGDDWAKEKVTWDEAMAFCAKINEQEKALGRLPEGYMFSLPTEAQWEYACRAGSSTPYSFGDDECMLDKAAWTRDNADGLVHAVGQKAPNVWGLYDMHGNVDEWCRDWYGAYQTGDVTDPAGPATGTKRVTRGGNYVLGAGAIRSAARGSAKPAVDCKGLGFRLALIPKSLFK